MLLQGTSGRKIGELRGHTSSVSHISLDAAHNHIFTLSLDKSIKVRPGCCSAAGLCSTACDMLCGAASASSWPCCLYVLGFLRLLLGPCALRLQVWDLRNHRCLQAITQVRHWQALKCTLGGQQSA